MKGDCVIIDFVRTPLCAMGTSLKNRTVDQVAQSTMDAIMTRTGLAHENLDHVIYGHAHYDTNPYNLARTAWLLTKLDENTPGYTVHACGASGIMALQKAYYLFKTGNDLTALVGGAEDYSDLPFILREARFQLDIKKFPVTDSIEEGELWTQPTPMDPRELAKKLAQEKGYSDADIQAFVDAEKAKANPELWEGHIAPVSWLNKKKQTESASEDVLPEVVDGFASYVDGAAGMLTAEADRAEELGLKPIAKVLGFASAACEPDNRWLGAVDSVKKLMARHPEVQIADVKDIEVIADSAASTMAIIDGLKSQGFAAEAMNPNGGSVLYGVNEGGDGVIATERCLLQLKKTGCKYGVVTAAMSGGQGMAMLVESL